MEGSEEHKEGWNVGQRKGRKETRTYERKDGCRMEGRWERRMVKRKEGRTETRVV